jgi:DNA repair protein RecO (recombination protein O)
MRIELQAAYLLSSRPYLESSLLLETFTREYGRVAMIARGVKRAKISKAGILQPFNKLLLSWYGKGPLYTMTEVELEQEPVFLQAKNLVNGLYLNELLVKLLACNDPHAELFDFYFHTIQELVAGEHEQIILRLFEKKLLITIGYALPLIKNIHTGETVKQDCYYTFDLEQGPREISAIGIDVNLQHQGAIIFKGSSLLALHKEKFSSKEELLDAKRLMRAALALRLGGQPLCTRELLL